MFHMGLERVAHCNVQFYIFPFLINLVIVIELKINDKAHIFYRPGQSYKVRHSKSSFTHLLLHLNDQ